MINNSNGRSSITNIKDAAHYSRDYLFGSAKWIEALQEQYGTDFFLITHDSQNASLPFAVIEHMGLQKIVSLPFSDYVRPTADSASAMNDLMEDLRQGYPHAKIRCDWIFPDNFDFQAFAPATQKTAYLHTVYTPDKATVRDTMKASFRNKIRQAKRHDLSTVYSNELSAVKEFYETYHSLRVNKFNKIPQPFSFFETIWEKFIKNDAGFVLTIKKNQTNIAFAICIEHASKIYYKFSCSKKEYLDYRPNNLLLSEIFDYACRQNFVAVDLGLSGTGPSYEGLVKFKDSTGGVRSSIHSFQHVPDSFDTLAEEEFRQFTHNLTDQIIEANLNPSQTSEFSRLIYPYFA